MGRYIVRRLLWVVVLVFAVVTITFLIFSVLPSGADPARLRAGRSPNPRLVEEIRHRYKLDQPVTTQYGLYISRPGHQARLRAQLPERHRRPGRDPQAPAGHDLAVDRGVHRVAVRRDIRGDHLGDTTTILARPHRHGLVPGGDLRARVLARPGLALPLRRRHREVPHLARRGQLHADHRRPVQVVHVADPAVARARRRVRGHLRTPGARQPDRDDVARTTSARRGPRACPSARSSCATGCARRSRRS